MCYDFSMRECFYGKDTVFAKLSKMLCRVRAYAKLWKL